MANAIRVASRSGSEYSDARIFSEGGPADGPEVSKTPALEAASEAYEAMSDGGLNVGGNTIGFGKSDEASYNDFYDMHYKKSGKSGIELSTRDAEDGDIVLAIFPTEKSIIPAKVIGLGRRMAIELPSKVKAGLRCFVMFEDGKLVSASLPSTGEDTIRLMPRASLVSWVSSVESDGTHARFNVDGDNGVFVVSDKKRGRKYYGHLRGYDGEIEAISSALSLHGLSGIVPNYVLRKTQGARDGEDNS